MVESLTSGTHDGKGPQRAAVPAGWQQEERKEEQLVGSLQCVWRVGGV